LIEADENCFGADLEYFDDLIENPSIDPATGQVSKCFVTVDRIGTAGSASATVAKKCEPARYLDADRRRKSLYL
jgi:hypothetical protein